MSTISLPNTFTSGTTILSSEVNSNFSTIYNDYNGNISNANISASAAIADTKLAQITTAGKVSGAAITLLTSVPSGAGELPAANLNIASQAEMETASDTEALATAGRVNFNPGVAKGWCAFNGTGTPAMLSGATHNFDASITDNGDGDYTVTLTTDMSSANYSVAISCAYYSGNVIAQLSDTVPTAGAIRTALINPSAVASDSDYVSIVAYGDQA